MNQPALPALVAFTLSLTAIPAFAGTIDPALESHSVWNFVSTSDVGSGLRDWESTVSIDREGQTSSLDTKAEDRVPVGCPGSQLLHNQSSD